MDGHVLDAAVDRAVLWHPWGTSRNSRAFFLQSRDLIVIESLFAEPNTLQNFLLYSDFFDNFPLVLFKIQSLEPYQLFFGVHAAENENDIQPRFTPKVLSILLNDKWVQEVLLLRVLKLLEVSIDHRIPVYQLLFCQH